MSSTERGRLTSRPVKTDVTNHNVFRDLLSNVDVNLDNDNVNDFAQNVSNALCKCSLSRRVKVVVSGEGVGSTQNCCWEKLLLYRDHSHVWQVDRLKGALSGSKLIVCLFVEYFKIFFSRML